MCFSWGVAVGLTVLKDAKVQPEKLLWDVCAHV